MIRLALFRRLAPGLCLALGFLFLWPGAGHGQTREGHGAKPLHKVRVQLKWRHQFQFAGYYAAVEKGFYREAGLDVELLEGKPEVDPLKTVLTGGAEYGVGTPELLINRAAGVPVVVLGVIFQHSPYVFLSLKGSGISSISDLAGKRVMVEPQSAELYAYLAREFVALDSVHVEGHGFSTRDLLDKKTDAMSAYSVDEPFTLEQQGVAYNTFSPRSAGIDFYGDCLFTTEAQIAKDPAQVKAFREATFKGWEYAFEHTEEICQWIFQNYPERKSLDALRFEAREMRPLVHPELIPVGYMNPGRWEHILSTYKELNMLQGEVNLQGFLYEPDPKPDYTLLIWIAGISIAAGLISLCIAIPVTVLNRKLQREIRDRKEAMLVAEETRDIATTALQVKNRFLSGISHDLRTPLTVILNTLHSFQPLREKSETLQLIHTTGDHMIALIDDLIEASMIEGGAFSFSPEEFSLESITTPLCELFSLAACNKRITLQWEVAPGLPLLFGDPKRLRQVLFNLLENAVKFTRAGSVRLSASQAADGWIEIAVEDTGVGISREAQREIFSPFFRAAQTQKEIEGHGLGLSIVKTLVETMGGQIVLTSEPGKGSRFLIRLPATG